MVLVVFVLHCHFQYDSVQNRLTLFTEKKNEREDSHILKVDVDLKGKHENNIFEVKNKTKHFASWMGGCLKTSQIGIISKKLRPTENIRH